MKLRIYGIRNCDAMKKAGVPPDRRPIVEAGPRLAVGFEPAEFEALR